MKNYVLILSMAVCWFGCTPKEQTKNGPLKVVTTTGMLYDAVLNIAKDKVEAQALMGPGVDPHLYKATQGDLEKLNKADLIIYNGLLLEGKLGEILEKLGKRKAVYAASSSIPESELLGSVQYENAFDPHIWFDVELWSMAVNEISTALIKEDPENAEFYKKNTREYLKLLDELHMWVQAEISSIPEKQRILVTAHDAFRYFGRAYDIQVEGLQGISTVSDFGLRDISQLTELIISRNIKAIFVETSVSDKSIKAVLNGCIEKGHDVSIGGYLFSDAMGEFGTEEGTYLGMVKSNVVTITQALK
ncbi:MAG: zinc ABC transporter substrate-binding protein [Cyclobacteriaceae bacterium]